MKNILYGIAISCMVLQVSNAQIKNTKALTKITTKPLVPGITSTAVWTSFKPNVHGFKFANTFSGVDASARWGGLCGGMVYGALDYYYANVPVPQQTFAPANRYPLQSYLFNRQSHSMQESNFDKWAELFINPGGVRNNEFYGWGIEMKNPGDRMNELKSEIDKGKPVPLGLYHTDDAAKYGYTSGGDHQVLAIGYDFGRYKGDKGAYIEDFKIFIYDPNFPKEIKTLVADNVNKCFHYQRKDNERPKAWLAYFVNKKYEKHTPLNIADFDNKRTLFARFGTGKDDLRGGNDNVSITITYEDGSKQVFPNVNKSAVWIERYCEVVPLQLNREINNRNEIVSFSLECSLGGGWNGDNWDMSEFKVTSYREYDVYVNAATTFNRDGYNLIKRFTGDDRFLTVNVVR